MIFEAEVSVGGQFSDEMGGARGEASEFAGEGSCSASPPLQSVAEVADAGVIEHRREGRLRQDRLRDRLSRN
jgi:hypothetical protein